ncbi:hypothetical protein [Streptomyces sp. NBC_00114]|uniref:hypothetical protein n=1 Tax=Streptomyces sp. NBC_00114 TaxID=2975656 RepID=UPI0038688478
MRDFIHQGFNEDPEGRRVFDGLLPHVAGAGRLGARGLLGGEPSGVPGARVRPDEHLGAGQRLVGEELGRLVEHGGIRGGVAEGAHPVGVEGETAAEPLVHAPVFAPPGQHDERAARGEAFGFVPGGGRQGGRRGGHGEATPVSGQGEWTREEQEGPPTRVRTSEM